MKKKCNHSWTLLYRGITEQYYCIYCLAKAIVEENMKGRRLRIQEAEKDD